MTRDEAVRVVAKELGNKWKTIEEFSHNIITLLDGGGALKLEPERLKPCPFCGLDVEWHKNPVVGVAIRCGHCGIEMSRGTNIDDTAGAWNKRVGGA